MADHAVVYELQDTVAVVRLDDGKANALSYDVVAALGAALDRAEREARALLLVGRTGCFSGGFDLSVMRQGREAAAALMATGTGVALRLYGSRLPVVIACTGHAVAMGAVLLLAADLRIGAEGSFKIGLNEVAIEMTLPVFAVELARDRLSRRHFARATLAEMYAPAGAVDAGYLDRVLPAAEVLAHARGEAARLGALDPQAFATTRTRVRGRTLALIRDTLAEDMRRIVAGE